MAKIRTLVGVYDIHGQKLKGSTHTLLIVSRDKAKQTKSKTSRYLLGIPHGEKERQYISSIYETNQKGVYQIEFKGKRYTLHFNWLGEVVEVRTANSHVYHKELFSKNEKTV